MKRDIFTIKLEHEGFTFIISVRNTYSARWNEIVMYGDHVVSTGSGHSTDTMSKAKAMKHLETNRNAFFKYQEEVETIKAAWS